MKWSITTHFFETSWITLEVTRKRFLLYQEVMDQSHQSTCLGLTVQGIKSKKTFCFQNL